MTALRVTGLSKRLGGRQVLDGVDLAVGPGEVVALLGPNGAGKTTLFRLVAGLLRPDAGRVELGAGDALRDLAGLPLHARARAGLGYVPQQPSVFQLLTVEQNLHAVLEAAGVARRERGARAGALAAELGLEAVRGTLAQHVSGGERRRLELARLLPLRPSVLLLDEPFTGLDPIAAEEVAAILGRLARGGAAVLLTDHAVERVLRLAARVCVLSRGRAVARGTPAEVAADVAVREHYLGATIGGA